MGLPNILIPKEGQTLIHGPSMAHQSAVLRDLIGSASIVHGATVVFCCNSIEDGTGALQALTAWQQHHKIPGSRHALAYVVSDCYRLTVDQIVAKVEANLADADHPAAPAFVIHDASRSTRPVDATWWEVSAKMAAARPGVAHANVITVISTVQPHHTLPRELATFDAEWKIGIGFGDTTLREVIGHELLLTEVKPGTRSYKIRGYDQNCQTYFNLADNASALTAHHADTSYRRGLANAQ